MYDAQFTKKSNVKLLNAKIPIGITGFYTIFCRVTVNVVDFL